MRKYFDDEEQSFNGFSMDPSYFKDLPPLKEHEDYYSKFYLSTELYYFKYRPDKNNMAITRATLYKKDVRVDDVRVSAGYGMPDKDHHAVINYFESRITLRLTDDLK